MFKTGELCLTFFQERIKGQTRNLRWCKTVVFYFIFFSKSVKKSVKRGVRVLRAKRVRREKKTVFLPSIPGLTLRFQPRSRPFVWLFGRTWIYAKIRAVLQSSGGRDVRISITFFQRLWQNGSQIPGTSTHFNRLFETLSVQVYARLPQSKYCKIF